MSKISQPAHLCLATLSAAALLGAAAAHAGSNDPNRKAACAAAYEKAQELQSESKLVEAKQYFITCSADDCPEVVRKECNASLPTIEQSLPTVVLGARDEKGNDILDAEVKIDGAVVAHKLDGKAIAVNPGAHQFQFTAPSQEPIERQIVVRAGEKNRVIAVDFKHSGAADPASNGEKPGDQKGTGGEKPIGAYVLGGIGVVALGAFAGLGITGKSALSDLQNGCGKTHSCAQDDVDSVKTKLLAADISLGVGIVSLGIGAALFFAAKPSKTETTAALLIPVLTPLPGGGAVSLVGQF